MKIVVAAILIVSSLLLAHASARPDPANRAGFEERLHAFLREIRCLVCQNETLADSSAELAIDLRNEIREQMMAGVSDAEIRDFLTARYGDFVLYRPPLKPSTYLLWWGPFALLAIGLIALYRAITPYTAAALGQPPATRELRRVRRLLDLGDGGDRS
jgi:cytochrome c-type biogenesis protein CcmH